MPVDIGVTSISGLGFRIVIFQTERVMNYESVNNYYETLVAFEIGEQLKNGENSEDMDYIEDVACVALNKLPPRYVRHHVDLVYYLTDEEKLKMDNAVRMAVSEAVTFVNKHRQR